MNNLSEQMAQIFDLLNNKHGKNFGKNIILGTDGSIIIHFMYHGTNRRTNFFFNTGSSELKVCYKTDVQTIENTVPFNCLNNMVTNNLLMFVQSI